MRADFWRTALWAAVLTVGVGLGVLWAAGRDSGGAEITAAGVGPGGDAEGARSLGAAQVGAMRAAESRLEVLAVAGGPGDWDSLGAGPAVLRGAADNGSGGGADDESEDDAAEERSGDDTVAVMVAGRARAVPGCGERFVSGGEVLSFVASGFVGGASVSFTGLWASFAGGGSQALVVVGATADADGALGLSWTVPAAPDVATDAAPRAYAIQASGENPDGGTHTAMMIEPLVSYPATVLCAAGDTASTALGTPVQIAVLANDTAPTGGTLDGSTVEVRPAAGGTFTVEGTTGAVTFTPDEGFWGDVHTTYAVYDGWGIGVEADLVVTVDAGCTITGTPGVTEITGTSGDDVICVPDRDDWSSFFVIDGRGGDDVILGGAGVEWAYGGNGADTIHGGGGDDRIGGGPGIDTIHGGPGTDTLRGGAGDDRLWGGIDADSLDGGNGVDHADGGPGSDACTRASTTAGCESAEVRR